VFFIFVHFYFSFAHESGFNIEQTKVFYDIMMKLKEKVQGNTNIMKLKLSICYIIY
jgi:hypothetical protein